MNIVRKALPGTNSLVIVLDVLDTSASKLLVFVPGKLLSSLTIVGKTRACLPEWRGTTILYIFVNKLI
jgi:hypothetical protein